MSQELAERQGADFAADELAQEADFQEALAALREDDQRERAEEAAERAAAHDRIRIEAAVCDPQRYPCAGCRVGLTVRLARVGYALA